MRLKLNHHFKQLQFFKHRIRLARWMLNYPNPIITTVGRNPESIQETKAER